MPTPIDPFERSPDTTPIPEEKEPSQQPSTEEAELGMTGDGAIGHPPTPPGPGTLHLWRGSDRGGKAI